MGNGAGKNFKGRENFLGEKAGGHPVDERILGQGIDETPKMHPAKDETKRLIRTKEPWKTD
jgi:hypothetical protein